MRFLTLRTARLAFGGAIVLALATAVRSIFRAVVVTHGLRVAEHASVVWTLLLLASFVGLGTMVNATMFPRARADLGLRGAWGWGVALAVGGNLCAFGVAYRKVLLGFVVCGLVFVLADVIHRLRRWADGARFFRRRRLRLIAADAPFFAGSAAIFSLGILHTLAAAFNHGFNANDDNLAYFHFAREILERGTLTQPFSLRRISAYSGKSFLDALQLAIDVPETHLHVLDKGAATLAILALIFGHAMVMKRGARSIYLLAMLFVVWLLDSGINSSSMRTGVVFFLGLYRTMTWAPVANARGYRSAVPVALLAAGACTLRQNYLPPVAALLVVAYGQPILRSLRVRPFRIDGSAVKDALLTAALLVFFLEAWWVMAWKWSGTFLFPIRKGFYNPAYSFFPSLKAGEWLRYVWVNVAYDVPVKGIAILLVAALSMRDRLARKPLTALLFGGLVGFGGLLAGYPAATVVDQSRYYFGFTFAGVIAIALAAAELASRQLPAGRRRADQAASVALVVVGLGVQMYDERDKVSATYKTDIEHITADATRWVQSSPDARYAALQGPVPAGAPIAVAVDEPAHFDQARNRIESLDMIGGVSPPPGIPLAQGGEAVAEYLVKLGYRYLVLVDQDAAKSLYRRDVWVRQQDKSDPVWQQSAHFYIEAFDAFDLLRATRVHLADGNGMTTLDLATKKP